MNRCLIIVPLFVLPLCSGVLYAGNESVDVQPNIAAQEQAVTLSEAKGDSQSKPELETCAMMDAAADPRVLASAMLAGLNPRTYLSFMQKLTNPEALRHYLTAVTPQSTLDRAYSATAPEFQTALLSRATAQKMASNWQQAMRDPDYLQSAVYVSSKPVQWANVTTDGHQTGSMMNWFDPKTYMGWMRLMAIPRAQDVKAASNTSANPAPIPLVFATPPQRY